MQFQCFGHQEQLIQGTRDAYGNGTTLTLLSLPVGKKYLATWRQRKQNMPVQTFSFDDLPVDSDRVKLAVPNHPSGTKKKLTQLGTFDCNLGHPGKIFLLSRCPALSLRNALISLERGYKKTTFFFGNDFIRNAQSGHSVPGRSLSALRDRIVYPRPYGPGF